MFQEMEVPASDLRYVRGHKDGDPKLLDQGGQTELIYAPKPAQTPQSLAKKIGGRVVGSAATGKTSPDAYGINRGPKDWDIRIEGKTSTKQIRRKMKSLGFEFQGGSIVSPDEAKQFEKQFGKKFAPGWNNVEHFTNKSGQKVDVWHSEGLFGVKEINKTAGKALGKESQ